MNSKNSILLVDPEFDPATASGCSLLIKVTADNYSYAILDKSDSKLKALYDQQESKNPIDDLAQRLKSDNYLSIAFQDVKASVYTQNTVAIPEELFEEQNLDQYAKFFTTTQSEKLHSQKLDSFGFTSIFNLENKAENILAESFQGCKIFDHSAPLLSLVKNQQVRILLLDFTVGFFNATYTVEEKLQFQHSFEISNDDEFNYYLLLMIKQLSIDSKSTNVMVSGIIHDHDKRFEILSKYFNQVEFNIPHPGDLNIDLLEDMPNHYYSTLLAVDLCG
ncbi:DUF3822 family protein [Pedobacter sp. PWIIR3]